MVAVLTVQAQDIRSKWIILYYTLRKRTIVHSDMHANTPPPNQTPHYLTITASPACNGHETSLKSPCGATSNPSTVAAAGHGNVGVGPSHVPVAPSLLTLKIPYDTSRYGREVYVFVAEMVPPTVNSWTRCEFGSAPGGAQLVRGGAQPPANAKLQVFPAWPAGKGIERRELVSCWIPTWVVW